jgi:hypothetical protein
VKGENKITEKEIFERQYDKPLENAIIDEDEMTIKDAQDMGFKKVRGNLQDKVRLKYPKVIITKNIIRFYNKCKTTKEVAVNSNNTYSAFSIGMRKIGIYKLNMKQEQHDKYSESKSVSVAIYDTDGNITQKKELVGGGGIVVSNDGAFVHFNIISSEGYGTKIYFYDKNGKLLKDVAPFQEKGYYDSYKASYSNSGKYIAISFDRFGEVGGYLILFDSDGNELWRKKISDWDNGASQVIISPKDNYVYTSGTILKGNTTNNMEGYVECYKIDGNEVLARSNGPRNIILKRGIFSHDDKHLVLSLDNDIQANMEHNVELIDLPNAKTLWIYKDTEGKYVDSFDFVDEDKIAFTMHNPNDPKIRKLIIVNENGQMIYSDMYVASSVGGNQIAKKISANGELSLVNSKEIKTFDINK